jgi:hypothetical protein
MTQNSINSKMPIVQVVTASTSSVLTINTGWATDTSIPQKTEGIEILTCTLTPTNANNLLVVKAFAFGDVNNVVDDRTLGIFQDDVNNALFVSNGNYTSGTGWGSHTTVFCSFIAGTTSSTIIKLRASVSGNIWYINGNYMGTSQFNVANTTYLEVMEIKV